MIMATTRARRWSLSTLSTTYAARRSASPISVSTLSTLLAFFLAATACTNQVLQPADETSLVDPELLDFYTGFCTEWKECVPNFAAEWSSVQECAEYSVMTYEKLPTACLNRVITYHQCGIDSECDAFKQNGTVFTCVAERDAIKNVDCGGMSAP